MTSPVIPTILAIVGLFFAFNTYTSIRRGGARHYTLEREAVLRRAMFTLLVSALAFTASVALLVTGLNQLTTAELELGAEDSGVAESEAEPTSVEVESFPPTPEASPSPFPTATATPIVVRGMVEGTAGSGLSLREEPSTESETVQVLADGVIVTILEEDAVEANGIVWVRVRTITNQEGWVSEQYLTVRER